MGFKMKRNWRELVDRSVRNHLEKEINEASRHKKAYRNSKNPSNAQLWCAIGNLAKQVFDINLKLNYLESALREISTKKKKVKKKRK